MRIFTYCEHHPDKTLAVTDDGSSILYREMLETGEMIRERAGHRLIFILCRNMPGTLLGYLGSLHAGAVPLLLDAEISPVLLEDLIRLYHPAFIVVPGTEREKAEAVSEKAGFPPAAAGEIRDSVLLRTDPDGGPELAPELALLLTTSGSTGSQKLVRLTGENLDANAESIAQYLRIDENERPVTMLPMNYSYGMSVINSHLLKGAPIMLTDHAIMERGFWERVIRDGVTSLVGVPYTYEIFRRLDLMNMDLPALRTLTQAGGKLPTALHEAFASWALRTGRRFYVMYGQTEAAPRMGYLPAERALEKRGSMGIAIPGGKLMLMDEAGKEITKPDIVGELVYEGPNVAMGYAVKPEDLALGDEWHGRLVTGDMAKKDEEGFFYITGRKKRFLKIMGKRLNLDEAERILGKEFPDTAFACVGNDRILCVYAEKEENVKEEEEPLAERWISYLEETTGISGRSVRVHFVKKIPRSDSGKIQYAKLVIE